RRALERFSEGAPSPRHGDAHALRVRAGRDRPGRGRAARARRPRHGRRAPRSIAGLIVNPESALAADPLLALRPEFPTLETTLHCASHTLGAMPRGVEAALARYADEWRRHGIRAWEKGWFALPVETGNLLGSLLNAEPGSISMHENTTTAEAIAL